MPETDLSPLAVVGGTRCRVRSTISNVPAETHAAASYFEGIATYSLSRQSARTNVLTRRHISGALAYMGK